MTTIPPETPPEANAHTAEVRELTLAVRALLQRVPGFAYPAAGARRSLNFSGAVKDQALEAVAAAIESSEPLSAAAQTSARELRDAIAFNRAYRSLADELKVLSDAVRYTIQLTRADATRKAFQTYRIAQNLNHPADRVVLVPHLNTIREAIRVRRPRTADGEPSTPNPNGGTA